MYGGVGSSLTEGPEGVLEPEKRPESKGKMKRRSSGNRDCSVCDREGGGALGSRAACWGRRRGAPPPNWCTRTPGPPPILKTKPGPSNRPPPVVFG